MSQGFSHAKMLPEASFRQHSQRRLLEVFCSQQKCYYHQKFCIYHEQRRIAGSSLRNVLPTFGGVTKILPTNDSFWSIAADTNALCLSYGGIENNIAKGCCKYCNTPRDWLSKSWKPLCLRIIEIYAVREPVFRSNFRSVDRVHHFLVGCCKQYVIDSFMEPCPWVNISY